MFGHLFRNFEFDPTMSTVIEKRWAAEEKPLFVLGALAIPSIAKMIRQQLQLPALRRSSSSYSVKQIAKLAHVYFVKLVDTDPDQSIIEEMMKWLTEDHPCWSHSFSDTRLFWNYYSDEFPAWSRLAHRLNAAQIQSASCERLFKDYARFQSESRNRLSQGSSDQLVHVKSQLAANMWRTWSKSRRTESSCRRNSTGRTAMKNRIMTMRSKTRRKMSRTSR